MASNRQRSDISAPSLGGGFGQVTPTPRVSPVSTTRSAAPRATARIGSLPNAPANVRAPNIDTSSAQIAGILADTLTNVQKSNQFFAEKEIAANTIEARQDIARDYAIQLAQFKEGYNEGLLKGQIHLGEGENPFGEFANTTIANPKWDGYQNSAAFNKLPQEQQQILIREFSSRELVKAANTDVKERIAFTNTKLSNQIAKGDAEISSIKLIPSDDGNSLVRDAEGTDSGILAQNNAEILFHSGNVKAALPSINRRFVKFANDYYHNRDPNEILPPPEHFNALVKEFIHPEFGQLLDPNVIASQKSKYREAALVEPKRRYKQLSFDASVAVKNIPSLDASHLGNPDMIADKQKAWAALKEQEVQAERIGADFPEERRFKLMELGVQLEVDRDFAVYMDPRLFVAASTMFPGDSDEAKQMRIQMVTNPDTGEPFIGLPIPGLDKPVDLGSMPPLARLPWLTQAVRLNQKQLSLEKPVGKEAKAIHRRQAMYFNYALELLDAATDPKSNAYVESLSDRIFSPETQAKLNAAQGFASEQEAAQSLWQELVVGSLLLQDGMKIPDSSVPFLTEQMMSFHNNGATPPGISDVNTIGNTMASLLRNHLERGDYETAAKVGFGVEIAGLNADLQPIRDEFRPKDAPNIVSRMFGLGGSAKSSVGLLKRVQDLTHHELNQNDEYSGWVATFLDPKSEQKDKDNALVNIRTTLTDATLDKLDRMQLEAPSGGPLYFRKGAFRGFSKSEAQALLDMGHSVASNFFIPTGVNQAYWEVFQSQVIQTPVGVQFKGFDPGAGKEFIDRIAAMQWTQGGSKLRDNLVSHLRQFEGNTGRVLDAFERWRADFALPENSGITVNSRGFMVAWSLISGKTDNRVLSQEPLSPAVVTSYMSEADMTQWRAGARSYDEGFPSSTSMTDKLRFLGDSIKNIFNVGPAGSQFQPLDIADIPKALTAKLDSIDFVRDGESVLDGGEMYEVKDEEFHAMQITGTLGRVLNEEALDVGIPLDFDPSTTSGIESTALLGRWMAARFTDKTPEMFDQDENKMEMSSTLYELYMQKVTDGDFGDQLDEELPKLFDQYPGAQLRFSSISYNVDTPHMRAEGFGLLTDTNALNQIDDRRTAISLHIRAEVLDADGNLVFILDSPINDPQILDRYEQVEVSR